MTGCFTVVLFLEYNLFCITYEFKYSHGFKCKRLYNPLTSDIAHKYSAKHIFFLICDNTHRQLYLYHTKKSFIGKRDKLPPTIVDNTLLILYRRRWVTMLQVRLKAEFCRLPILQTASISSCIFYHNEQSAYLFGLSAVLGIIRIFRPSLHLRSIFTT